jgi:hypothetical protein
MIGNRQLLVVEGWNDHPVTKEIQNDAMVMLAVGVWYHVRLDLFVIIESQLDGLGAAYIQV